jgi:N-acetylglutamate synthase
VDEAGLFELDESGLLAWPYLAEEHLGDWQLRFSNGVYGRSNSVTMRGDPGTGFEHAVSICQEQYAEKGLQTLFRIPNIGQWHTEDSVLGDMGYRLTDRSEVHIGPVIELVSDPQVRLGSSLTSEWLETYLSSSNRGKGKETTVSELFEKVPFPRRFAQIEVNQVVTAIGMGCVVGETLWIFGVATSPSHRGQGFATRVAKSLLTWSSSEGAGKAALQVSADNEAALRLWKSLGFALAYRYHYRRKP